MSENTYTGRYQALMEALAQPNNAAQALGTALEMCNRLWDFLLRELEGEAIKQIEQIAEESNAKED